jgi:hypothetical protein
MEKGLVWAAAISVAILPVLYPVLGVPQIMQGCNPRDLYWRRRLRLNLMGAHLGMFLNLALALAAAMLLKYDSPLAWPLIALAAVIDLIYTAWIVAMTPRDWWHALPTGIAMLCYVAACLAAYLAA